MASCLLNRKRRKDLAVARAKTDAEAVALAVTDQIDGIAILDESSGLSVLKCDGFGTVGAEFNERTVGIGIRTRDGT